MKITRGILLLLVSLIWALFVGLSASRWNGLNLLNGIGFLSLLLVPGLILTLSMRAGHNLPFWVRLGQIVGLSLLSEVGWILLCNTVLPHLRVMRPLDQKPVLIELSVLNLLLGIWSWRRLKYLNYFVTWQKVGKSITDAVMSWSGIILVILAVTGAISLNNGSTNAITMVMLGLCSMYFLLLLILRKRLADSSIAWALYFVSLALLLMTSMRGWYITGHDIQHEYLVFRLTQAHGRWNIAYFRDPYNSCLSLTILPTILFNTLHIGMQYVYKILFQIIFAIVPVLIYRLMRLYLSKAKSMLAVIYFIAFPTYFTDMAFLNRQEIAFLFLALMLLFILSKRIALRKRQALFVVFGLGVVLAHYSTTYAVLIILIVAVVLRLFLSYLLPHLRLLLGIFRHSSVDILQGQVQVLRVITVPMVLTLITAGFVWNVVLTDTANGAETLLSQLTATLRSGSTAGTRSNDVSYSLLAPKAVEPQKLVDDYLKTAVTSRVIGAPKGVYYPSSVTNAYPIHAAHAYYAPLTRLGHYLSKKVSISKLNYDLKQSSAKLMQVFVLLGLCYVVLANSFGRSIDTDYFTLSLGSGLFVGLQVILPFLSEAYGILRAFQQSLMLLGLYLVAGTYAIARPFRKLKPVYYAIPVGAALIFFLATTGVLSELLGGYQPQLQLNNSGVYYDQYYMHGQELAADQWLVHTVIAKDPHASVQTDLDTAIRLDSVTGFQAQNDITPSQVETYAYVLLGYNDTVNHQVFISYAGNTITYTYPMQFLNTNKNLIYSNGGSEIYR